MDARDKSQLIVYEGDYQLPSLDADSTKSILYAAATGATVEVRALRTARLCLFYGAPCFVHKNVRFATFDETVLYLKTLGYNLDARLDARQSGECLAYSCYARSKLKPYLEFVYWVDSRNREEFTNVWYMKSLPFPFNYVYTSHLKNKATDLLECLYPTETNNEVIKEFVSRAAVECLSSLSTRLGTLDYFFGNSLSTLDITVYAYLAPLIKLKFPLNELSNIPSRWSNLANFVKRIDSVYFPDLPKKPKYLKVEEKPKAVEDDVSYVAIFILTVSATSLLLGFAFNKGLLFNRTY